MKTEVCDICKNNDETIRCIRDGREYNLCRRCMRMPLGQGNQEGRNVSKTVEYVSLYGSLELDSGSNYFTSFIASLNSRILSKRDAVAYILFCRGINPEDLALYTSKHNSEFMVNKVLMSESFPDICEDIREIGLELSIRDYLTILRKLEVLKVRYRTL